MWGQPPSAVRPGNARQSPVVTTTASMMLRRDSHPDPPPLAELANLLILF
ncbi:MAG: hypothetical protein WCA76_14695 [Candidatus Sulfotelmatobacter sp.]|jgi:hypothetical protein